MKTFATVIVLLVTFLLSTPSLWATDPAIGTWVRRDVPMTSTVERLRRGGLEDHLPY